MVLVLTFKFPFRCVIASTPIKLVKEGFPKEIISTIKLGFIPIGIAISIFVGARMKIGREMTWALRFYIARFIDTFFSFVIIMNYNSTLNGFNLLTI